MNPLPDGDARSEEPRPSLLHKLAGARSLRARFRRLFLQFGAPWGAAIVVGLVAVLYAQWTTDVSNTFVAWVAGRPWLAFVVTPALTMLAVFLTRRWFSGSEGSGIPQVIAALPVVVTGLLCGLFGAAFNWALLNWERWMPAPVRAWRAGKPLLYALAIGLAVAALGVATGGETWGSGYDQARHLLEGTAPLNQTYAVTKWAAMVISYMAGIPGGLFSPSLSIGAGLAQWVHAAFPWAGLAALIALCMTGYLAAVTQSPLTSFVIVMEMTNGTGMLIPMMATALLAARISGAYASAVRSLGAKELLRRRGEGQGVAAFPRTPRNHCATYSAASSHPGSAMSQCACRGNSL